MTVQLEYTNHLSQFLKKILPIMLASCLMLSVTYYAQNYAGIIGWSLMAVAIYTQYDGLLSANMHWRVSTETHIL